MRAHCTRLRWKRRRPALRPSRTDGRRASEVAPLRGACKILTVGRESAGLAPDENATLPVRGASTTAEESSGESYGVQAVRRRSRLFDDQRGVARVFRAER